MARGFESKDIEYQQAERERLRDQHQPPVPAERDAASRRRSIELSLARMHADARLARAPAHRAMLSQAIATLEAELASLS
jgi:hypothetical protein